jgi:hypothetical protein
MPIIINEFEIVTEPHAPEQALGQTAGPPEPPPTLHPEGIVRIERRYRERMNRIRAD